MPGRSSAFWMGKNVRNVRKKRNVRELSNKEKPLIAMSKHNVDLAARYVESRADPFKEHL